MTVFPGSHRNSELHRVYPAQKRGEVDKLDLGKGMQIRLQQGDVVIAHSLIAHRRADNWSSAICHMVYFRLQPAHVAAGWGSRADLVGERRGEGGVGDEDPSRRQRGCGGGSKLWWLIFF